MLKYIPHRVQNPPFFHITTDPKYLTRMTIFKRYSNLPHLMDMFSILALPAQLLYQATQLQLNKQKMHKYLKSYYYSLH